MNLYALLRPLIFCLPEERAHQLSIAALKSNMLSHGASEATEAMRVRLAGLTFDNPLGLAAGYDKGGKVPLQLMGLGFGHVEIGTVTPLPQRGNEKPRLFRLVEDRAVINRMGFNSEGHERVLQRLQRLGPLPGRLGVNLGANKTSTDFVADYCTGIERFAAIADYLTINISSPNTPGLRNLQARDELRHLLESALERRSHLSGDAASTPIFLKIAPDLDDTDLDDITHACEGARPDGLIISNTTLARPATLQSQRSKESGGLSGQPLFDQSTRVLAQMNQRVGSAIPLIGVGGVSSLDQLITKFEAGACMVQLYSAMVFHGPGLPKRLLSELDNWLGREKIDALDAIIGRRSAHWAGKVEQ